jgi:hypothetical protein
MDEKRMDEWIDGWLYGWMNVWIMQVMQQAGPVSSMAGNIIRTGDLISQPGQPVTPLQPRAKW